VCEDDNCIVKNGGSARMSQRNAIRDLLIKNTCNGKNGKMLALMQLANVQSKPSRGD
jgi:hypothetical protein